MHPKAQLPPFVVALSIGGVELRVHSEYTWPGAYEPVYQPFLVPPTTPVTDKTLLNITVLDEPAPANRTPPMFDSGENWTMQAEKDGYRINLRRGGSQVFHTVVRSDAVTTQASVYIGQDAGSGARSAIPAEGLGSNPIRYPLDQLLLMNHLAERGGVIVHGAGLRLEDSTLLFAGPSGAGKSTIARLFAGASLGGALLSDDRVVIRSRKADADASRTGVGVTAWGTPWAGDAKVAQNSGGPLAGLIFLVQASTDELHVLSETEAARRLMPVITCPWYDPVRAVGVLDTCSLVVRQVPCYELHFRESPAVVDLIRGHAWGGKAA